METKSTIQKPQSISTAINLLWTSLVIGAAKALMDFTHISATSPAMSTLFVLVLTFALLGFLIYKISTGKNWARITFTIMFVLGMLPTVPYVMDEFSRSSIVGALSLAQIGLQGFSLYLLFSQPGGGWFRKVAPA